jgi:hypothetical protein
MDLSKECLPIKTDELFSAVLGPSGAGKSHLIGTYPGKTLYIYGSSEGHGPASASKSNKNGILAVAWDRTKDDKGDLVDVPPEKILKRIKDLLNPEMLTKAGVKCVALDSWTNLMIDFKTTPQFKQRITDPKTGKPNPFKDTEALIELASGVIRDLQTLSDYHKIDVITTIDLQIQSIGDDGAILESKPSLPTFGVAKAIVQAFADVLVLGRMGNKRTPVLQNFAMAASSSVDRETKVMTKYVEFSPRLRGVDDMPETMVADLKEILKLKG